MNCLTINNFAGVKNIIKKISFYILIFSFLNYTGCYSSTSVSKEILYEEDQEGLLGEITINTNEAKRIELLEGTYQVFDDTLYSRGFDKTNTSVYGQSIDIKIALADIQNVEINELNASKTAGCVIGSAGLILLIIGLIAAVNSVDKTPKSCAPEGFGFEGGKD